MQIHMNLTGAIPGEGTYLGWTPRRVTLTVHEIPPGSGNIPLRVTSTGAKGRLVFTLDRTVRAANTLDLTINPANPVAEFFVAGEFGFASQAKDDAELTVTTVGSVPVAEARQRVTIRVRKNANSNELTQDERDRFLFALAKVNNQGQGPFQAIRDMHKESLALFQAHRILPGRPFPEGNEHFLPWHRAYLLDLERHLQAVDPTVSLHYWKFDEPASKVLSAGFMGATSANSGGSVTFNPANPLIAWRTDNGLGINREALFNQRTESPLSFGGVESQDNVLNLGGADHRYSMFSDIEEVSHNGAHGSFDFHLSNPATAPRDPLFFLLHCNVDRLWAHWQWLRRRFTKTSETSYSLQGQSPQPDDIGRRTLDTMWPWDNVRNGQRPATVPRAGLPNSPSHAAPGIAPSIASMIDYQGKINSEDELGFDYDTVPYWD